MSRAGLVCGLDWAPGAWIELHSTLAGSLMLRLGPRAWCHPLLALCAGIKPQGLVLPPPSPRHWSWALGPSAALIY